jgi:dipeptidyl aminopeptidase/acylaminoacyl peptidase
MRARVFVLVSLFTFIAASVMAQTSTDTAPLTALSMWQLKRLGDPAISPDGKLAVVPVTHYDIDKNEGFTDLWLVPTAGGEARQLTSDAASDNDPVFSPDGKWIAFVSKRGEDKQTQIYVIAPDGGEARRVTNVPTGADSPRWFPDSKRIAFITSVWPDLKTWEEMDKRMKDRTESRMTAKVWEKAPFSYWDHFIEDRDPHVYWISLAEGSTAPASRCRRMSRSARTTTSRRTATRWPSPPTPIAPASIPTTTSSWCR